MDRVCPTHRTPLTHEGQCRQCDAGSMPVRERDRVADSAAATRERDRVADAAAATRERERHEEADRQLQDGATAARSRWQRLADLLVAPGRDGGRAR